MDIGKQSTLNDLEALSSKTLDVEKKVNDVELDLKERGFSKKARLKRVSDINKVYETGNFSVNLINDERNNPSNRKGTYEWLHCQMQIHCHDNGYSLIEATEFFRDKKYFRRTSGGGDNPRQCSWVEFLTTANTVIDSNGFIKAA